MQEVIVSLVFAGALAVAFGVIAAMVVPQWRRIASLASGRVEDAFHPLARLAVAERRIAVRHWASRPAPADVSRSRAAA